MRPLPSEGPAMKMHYPKTLPKPTFVSLLAFSIIFSISVFSFVIICNAQTDPEIPTIHPYVNDFAGVIDPEWSNMMEDYAASLESNTTAQIAVLTVSSTQPMSVQEYANLVFSKNGIGQKGKDNGALIVAAIDDRQYWIEIGYGLEGDLNDAKVGRIARTYLVPDFKTGDYGQGLYLTLKAMGDVVQGNSTVDQQFSSDPTDIWSLIASLIDLIPLFVSLMPVLIIPLLLAVSVIAFVVSFIISLIDSRVPKSCPKCGGPLSVERDDDQTCYVCEKGHYRKCIRKRNSIWPLIFWGGSSWGGNGGSGGGGGSFGGGGSGGGGAGGGW
jgi:uncharacterized protein